MKISQVSEEYLLSLTPEQKWKIVCGGVADDGKSAEIAILLGSRPEYARERALAAAELYRTGRVKYIVPSGGVEWECPDGKIRTEAIYMKEIMMEKGVPEDAIVLENEARTTKENMIYAALQINRKTHFYSDKRVIIVTSINHMKRSLALAKSFLPRFVEEISAYPSYPPKGKAEWLAEQRNIALMDNALHLTWGLVQNHMIDDFELVF